MKIFLFRWQVSGVAFDSYWSPPSSDGNGENVYRFGSVGQVCLVYIARTVVWILKYYSTTYVFSKHMGIVASSNSNYIYRRPWYGILLIKIMTPEIWRPAFPFSSLAGLFWDLILMELWADFTVHCWNALNWSICFIFFDIRDKSYFFFFQYWWGCFLMIFVENNLCLCK